MGSSQRDRRVFLRVNTDGLPIEFDVPGRTGLLRRRGRTGAAGRLIDVSVSGAQILVPARHGQRSASVVTIRHAGSTGRVLVRWQREGPTPDTWMYGVEFLELDAPLRQYLGRPVDERRGNMPQYQFTSPIARPPDFS